MCSLASTLSTTLQQRSLHCLIALVCFVSELHTGAHSVPPSQSPKEFDTIYNMVRTDDMFMLKHTDLNLGSNLGKGNFGSVMRGTYQLRGRVIDVAVKVLKANDDIAEVSTILYFTRVSYSLVAA